VPATDTGPVAPPVIGRPRWLPHALALLLVLLAVTAIGGRDHGWTPDDGAYALQVDALDRTGGWAWPYPHADIDPDLRHVPFTHGVVTEEGAAYPYVKLPAWILVLRASTWMFGDGFGLYVPSLLGVLAAALVAWHLARRFDPDAAPWAFWATGVGALLVEGTAMWAHSAAAALAGVAAITVVDAAGGRRARVLRLAAVLAVLVLLRREGLLVAAATVAVLGVVGLGEPGGPLDRVRRAAWLTAAPTVAVVAAHLGNARWVDRIAPGTAVADGEFSSGVRYLEGRFSGAGNSLLYGAGEYRLGRLLAVAAIVFVAGAGFLLFRRRDVGAATVAAVTGLALIALRSLVVAPFDLAGLFVASPLLVVAAFGVRRSDLDRRVVAAGAWAATFAGAVLLTQYPEGGAWDWGGRFFLPLLIPAVVGSVIVWRRALASAGPGDRRRIASLAVALVVVPTLLGLYATTALRAEFRQATDDAVATGAPHVIRTPRFIARTSWSEIPDGDWMAASTPADVAALLAGLRRSGAGPVAVVGSIAGEVDAPGWDREVVSPTVVVFTPDP